MTRRLLPFLLLVLSCTTAPAPAPAASAPRLSPAALPRRVVLLSFDGLGADALARQKGLAAFERLAREGASARVIPVDPTLTAPAHVTMLTGVAPQKHGIVSNRFHLPNTPPERETRGSSVDPDVETIVELARRQGKRVGVVPFPTIDNRSARRTADFGLAWSGALVPARLVTLTRADFKREWVPPTWTARPQRRTSYSPIRRARIDWSVPRTPVRADVDVVAYDTTDDRVENYDAYFVESGDRELPFDSRGWFAVSQYTDRGLTGSWSKIVRATPALDVTLYWGAIARSEAWPESYGDLLDDHAGFWPGVPEEELDVDPEIVRDQLERLADFFTRAQTVTIERMPFDLLLAYQSQIDQASHEFLGTPHAGTIVATAFAAADRAVAAIAERLGGADAFLVTGDHGLVVAEREVQMNRLLAEHGFAPRWRAFTSGAHGHLYRSGEPDDAEAVVKMLTSSGLFERIERKGAGSHRNSGDIVVWAYPHIALESEEEGPFQRHGQHGGLSGHREFYPPLFAIGRGVTPGPLGEIGQTEIAGLVRALLGIPER